MIREDIRYLSERIGARFAGSKGEKDAAKYIMRRFSALGLKTDLQEYSYAGWSLREAPVVKLLSLRSKSLECAPLLYSSSTPKEGLIGKLKPAGTRQIIPGLYDFPQYDIVDEYGKTVANIIVETRGRAIPFLNPRSIFRTPQVVIGRDDYQYIQNQIDDNKDVKVYIRITTKYRTSTSYNVIAHHRPSKNGPRTIVCAHYDTTLNTPGAYDNASGVAALIDTAEKCLSQGVKKNIDFIAFSCEEVGIFGSDYYVNQQKERGLLDDIETCIDYDQVSGGDILWIWASPEQYATRIKRIIKSMKLPYECKFDPPVAGSDSWKFHQQGISGALIMFWRQPEYHKPTDTFEKIDIKKVEAAVKVGTRLVLGK